MRMYNPNLIQNPPSRGTTPLIGGGLARGTTLGPTRQQLRKIEREKKLARLNQQMMMQQMNMNRQNVPYHTHNISTGGPNQPVVMKPLPLRPPTGGYTPRPPRPLKPPTIFTPPTGGYTPRPMPPQMGGKPNMNPPIFSTLQTYSNASGGGCSLWMCGE